MKWKWKLLSCVWLSLTPWRPYSPWNSPGQNSGVGSFFLLQGIFLTQGLNPGLPHCRRILYQLSHKGSPRILEWVAYPFSGGSSWPRNPTGVSSIVDGFFTNWAIREAQMTFILGFKKKLHKLVMDREAWRATVHGVAKSQHDWTTQLNW